MARTLKLDVTAERSGLGSRLAYVTSPETHSTLLRVPGGKGPFTGTVEIDVIDTDRYPKGVDPPFEVHELIETWPTDRLRIESSAGLSQRAIHAMFPQLFAGAEEHDRKPSPVVSEAGHRLDPEAAEGPAAAWVYADGTCVICGEPMVALFDLDLTDARLDFLGLEGERLRIITCSGCTCYVPVYTEVDLSGGAHVSAETRWDGRFANPPWGELASVHLGIGAPVPYPRTQADLDDLADTDDLAALESRLGGRPGWVQAWDYPSCPRCAAPMPFLGQIALYNAPWDSEGTYYAFLDLGCSTACTTYQQT